MVKVFGEKEIKGSLLKSPSSSRKITKNGDEKREPNTKVFNDY
jgi:hypothetical protein